MTKPFYAEYANHAFRYYARHDNVKPSREQASNCAMWEACNSVMLKSSAKDNAIILAVYRSKCTIGEAVTCIARELNMPENKIWQLVNKYSKAFARERGIISHDGK